jgi:lycopene beta-cyclase|tara:strand:+ start:14277 stop:16319 length:2043 start_codon:yes stop_codon:yes gene_type:complete
MKKVQNIIYDFVFIGLGASNSLILISLIQKGLLKNKQIAIFEAESKTKNDKTYCFWAEQEESIVRDLSSIITHRFSAIQVSQSSSQNIEKQPYHYIRSIDLYDHTLQKLNEEQIKIHRKGVNDITCENEIYSVYTNNETYCAHYIFDSRSPLLNINEKNQVYLNQSFYGLHIKCEKNVIQENTFQMMNFHVDQDQFTQFMYVIPFSTNEALVELTRFGTDKIDVTYALGILDSFIMKDFGTYEILSDESGCIPMTTCINPPNPLEGILNTGASANLIKPSTGYGFKNMHSFAQLVTERIASNELEKFNKIALDSKKRFKFYDKLLLLILLHWPSKGKLIFTSLFKKQSILNVFSFLDEKSSLAQEFKIFASLPILPFLKALYVHLKNENWLRYIVAFLVVMTYLVLVNWHTHLATYFTYTVVIIGLLYIGVPHGALDHLLTKSKNASLFLFIFKYLFIIFLYYTFWQFYPLMALLLFIIYSSFHFGESELVESDKKIDSFGAHLKALLMGMSILFFIIFSHPEESLGIVSNLVTFPLSNAFDLNYSFLTKFTASLSLIYILLQTILSKRMSYLGLIFLLLLGVKVPLILAFGIYFVFQHSYNAWQHLKLGLQMNSLQMYKKSSFYTFGALLIFLLIVYYAKEFMSIEGLWANFFIFIACISFPHFFLMHVFYKTSFDKSK